MSNLTANRIAFLEKMQQSAEHERWGFETLSKRDDLLDFLDALVERGFFSPSRNPGPAPAQEEGFFRIPYWSALSYLEKASEKAGTLGKREFAKKIVQILQTVTQYKGENDAPIDNYHTWHSFATILSNLPPDILKIHDIHMLDVWLNSNFDSSLVGIEVGKRLLPKFLNTGHPRDLVKAIEAVKCLTKIKWKSNRKNDQNKQEPVTVVDDYWFREIFKNNATALGQHCGKQVSAILRQRLADVLKSQKMYRQSWLWRRAIEDHSQDQYQTGTFTNLVTALRDVLLAFTKEAPQKASTLLNSMLNSEASIEKRVALHVIDKNYAATSKLFWQHLSTEILQHSVLHELYWLLRNHFVDFSDAEKESVVTAIEQLPRSNNPELSDEEKEYYRKSDQRRWLYSIWELGYLKADNLLRELNSDPSLGMPPRNPDFLAYAESSIGPGPSPYSIDELLSTDIPLLIPLLNHFREKREWKAPTTRALVDTLELAIKQHPEKFQSSLTDLLALKPEFQYALLSAFKQIWENKQPLLWKQVLEFCWKLVESDALWDRIDEDEQERLPLTPTRQWIAPLICDLIRAGVQSDENAIDPELMPLAQEILFTILEKLPSTAIGKEDDAMTEAINTAKGRCIEAVFNFALRGARLADAQNQDHTAFWESISHVFDRELALCKNGNFEFSTLCGCYLANINYLSQQWLENNINHIFPIEFERNWNCAFQGLAYIPNFYQDIYLLIKRHGHFDKAIRTGLKGPYAQEKMLQMIGVAYLSEHESLDDPDSLIAKIFALFNEQDICEIVGFFWMHRETPPDDPIIARIMAFWSKCSVKIFGKEVEYKKVLSKLSLLATFIDEVNEREVQLLLQVAPYIDTDHNGLFFLEYLQTLVDKNPEAIGNVLLCYLANSNLVYDKDIIISIVNKINQHEHKQIALAICNAARDLPGIKELYASIQANQ